MFLFTVTKLKRNENKFCTEIHLKFQSNKMRRISLDKVFSSEFHLCFTLLSLHLRQRQAVFGNSNMEFVLKD